MEVMSGTTFSIEVTEYGSDLPATGKTSSSASVVPFVLSNTEEEGVMSRSGSGIWSGQTADYSSESSSSIGSPGDSGDEGESGEEDEGEGSEVSSKELGLRGLGSMSSLEDSLPIKRGLSNHYKGKSKSFGSLAVIGSVKDVPKQENPLNKRRRLQICNKWSRRSFYSWQNPKSMPLLPVDEDEADEEEEEEEDLKSGFDEAKSSVSSSSDEERRVGRVVARKPSFKNRAFKSQSCFALSDLQEEDDQ